MMYAFGRFILKKSSFRLRTSSTPYISVNAYHSENGVYGYKPRQRRHFEVSKEYLAQRASQSNFYRLVSAYRTHGHKQANLDPLSMNTPSLLPELQPHNFGLSLKDKVRFKGILFTPQDEGTIEEAVQFLNSTYSSTIGTEFSYLETEEEREWFAETVERTLAEPLDDETRRTIAAEMLKSQVFDNFLAVKFVSLKKYGGEGAESMMAFFHEFFKLCACGDLEHIIFCAAHRGRLNLLTGLLKFPPEKLFRKLQGLSEFPDTAKSSGDVISHLISSTDINVKGKNVHFTMLRNPSHLEIVNPVSMGKTRGVMQAIGEAAYGDADESTQWSDKVINLQVHGDAAYPGQGVNQECLALSGTPHFEIGGTIHLVINNQIGFTTPPSRGRSSRYCTDLAKTISAPVIHVNGDNPEMVVRATRIAFKYQRRFRKDVFVDLNCFRKWGHNELDDPVMTNPLMYKIVQSRPSIPDRYVNELIGANVLTRENAQNIIATHTTWLNRLLKENAKVESEQPAYFAGRWTGMKQAETNVTQWDTGVNLDLLRFVGEKSVQVPANLNLHPQVLKSHVQSRMKKINSNTLDWSTAEALAVGSLLYQGYNVRISGQDVGRGTFAQRHAMFVDQSTGAIFIPLNSMIDRQTGKLEIANSILSEEAVLGFEYGMSIASPFTLPIWEAQFGDFFNGAQIVIDTYVTNGEAKWILSSGLTMLLPHGYDGAGPEHSSCRLERFLQLTDSKETGADSDDVNMQIANPTEPAQYFHLLRRQMVRHYRKPLVIVAPKILLRHPNAVSSLSDLKPQSGFRTVIGDDKVQSSDVNKIILVSGKHYYALKEYRESIGNKNVAIIRIESLCPFPIQELLEEIEKYKHAKCFIWSQEEPRNMGAWSFVKSRFENLCGRQLKYSGRETMAAPAVGDGQMHKREANEVIVKPFTMK